MGEAYEQEVREIRASAAMTSKPERCITCGDVAVAATRRRGGRLRRRSSSVDGSRERSAIELVEPVEPGDLLLCHAGIALEKLVVRFVDEFRSGELAQKLAHELAAPRRARPRAEDHGGLRRSHAHDLQARASRTSCRDEVDFVHGPGCPVCVIPMGRVDDAIALAERPEVIFTTFGDMMRVPGGRGSLLEAKARGADVRMVYSPLDALEIARRNPEREVVFFAIGFETTAPATALTLLRARAEGIRNFSAFCNHVTIGPPLRAILDSPGPAARRRSSRPATSRR